MKTRINKGKEGFTLMEIMVVIIVIAVLASIAGPMIGAVTDQAKAAATKASMQSVKTALISYNTDLGKFPFCGTNASVGTKYDEVDITGLGTDVESNVLVSSGASGINLGIEDTIYKKRWKGPYMDADPGVFMVDAWESKIRYRYNNRALYLHSSGPDGNDDFLNCIKDNYEGDDIVISISRLKF